MARSNKFKENKATDTPTEQLMEVILEDVLKAGAMSFDEWWALSRFPLVPLAIPVNTERQYRVTQAGVNAAHQLTEQTWRARADFRQTIARSEFDKISFRAIGETILNCRSHLPSDAAGKDDTSVNEAFFAAMADDYKNNLERLANSARPDVDRHIPCHLFHTDQGVPPFSVGPVDFLPRANWIARYVKDLAQLEYIHKVESRETRFDELRDQALALNSAPDLHAAYEILSSLGNFEWVATIKMKG